MVSRVLAAGLRPAGASAPQSRLLRNIAVLAGGQLVTWALSLGWTLVVPRMIGPKGTGQLMAADSAASILFVVVALGINQLLIKEIARNPERAPSLVGTAFLIRGATVLPALLLMAIYVWAVHFDRQQTLLLWLAAATMQITLAASTLQSALNGLERMDYQVYTKVIGNLVGVPVGIALVLMGHGVVALMVMWVAMAGLNLLLSAFWRRSHFRLDWRVDPHLIRAVVVDSLPYWIGSVFFATYLSIDSVMLSVMTSAQVVGWYAAPTQVFTTLLVIPVTLSTAWFPRLAAAFQQDPERLRSMGRTAMELVLVLSFPVALGAAVVAAPMIMTLFGPQFAESAPVMAVLGLALPLTYLNIMAYQLILASDRQGAWVKVMAVASLANPLLNLALIAYFQGHAHNGAIGAALSLLVTEIYQGIAAILLMPRVLDRAAVLRLCRAALAALGMAGLVWVSRPAGLFAQITVGVVSFAALAALLRVLAADHVTELSALGRRLRARLGDPAPVGEVRP